MDLKRYTVLIQYMAKAYFFRIGMDTTGFNRKKKSQGIRKQYYGKKTVELPLGMVFEKEDNDFVYLPLLKYKFKKNQYSERKKLTPSFKIGKKKLWHYTCNFEEINKICLHYDPCFNFDGEYSYGDEYNIKTGKPWKAKYLEYLCPGDIIIFTELLVKFDSKKEVHNFQNMNELVKLQKKREFVKKLYVIGYFIVDKVVIYDSSQSLEEEKRIQKDFRNNAHIVEGELEFDCSEKNLILVKGTKDSRLLTKAIEIAEFQDRNYQIKKKIKTLLKKRVLIHISINLLNSYHLNLKS